MARSHSEWVSGVLVEERPTRFRYLAEQMDAGSYTSFAVDILEWDCAQRFVTLTVNLQQAITHDVLSAGLEGVLRVDRRPLRRVTYRVGAQAGARTLFIFITAIEGEAAFWKEMAEGSALRLRFPTERRDYHLKFPLQGFTAAQRRATTLCRSLIKEEDRAFFIE